MKTFDLKKFISEQRYREVVRAKESLTEGEGYVEAMGPDFDTAIEQLQSSWHIWKEGPMTDESMISDAREDILDYIRTKLV